MTKQDFALQMIRLKDNYPQHYGSESKAMLIYERVKDLDVFWFKKTVERILLSGEPRFNFEDAAKNERLHRRSLEFNKDLELANERVKEQMTDEGFQKVLNQFNASSAWEAVLKSRKMNHETNS